MKKLKKNDWETAVITGEPSGQMCPQCGHEMVKLGSGGLSCPYAGFSFGEMAKLGIEVKKPEAQA
jgi:tRNA(Ile2) C34 agmatinyltransferase TiaS